MSTTVERLMVEVQADVRQALSRLQQVENQSKATGGRIGKLGRSMGLAFGGSAVVGGLTKVASLAMDFDKTIRQVGVQTETTGKRLSGLSDLALKMGQDTIYSAQEAGSAMLELAKGGMTAAQIRAGGLEESLRLAAAGGVELAEAAGFMVEAMNAYGLPASRADEVTTALASGANASTASVQGLGQALSQAGAGAVDAGMSLQETVSALALFANNGIQGSDAGTSLKTALARLIPTTNKARSAMSKYNLDFVKGNGEFVSMTELAGQLQKELGGLGDAERAAALETIFGSDARRAASILTREGADGVRKMMKATRDQAKTQEMANSAMEGASGAWENFTGALETGAIKAGTKALPAIEDLLNMGTDLITEAGTWGPVLDESFGWMIDGAKAAGPPMKALGTGLQAVGGVIGDLPGPMKELGVQVGLAALLFPRLATAATTASARVTGAFTTMSAKARQFGAEMTYAETRTQRLGAVARQAAGMGGMLLLANAMGETEEEARGFKSSLDNIAGGALLGFSVGGPLGAAVGGLGGLATAFGDVQAGVARLLGVEDQYITKTWDAKAVTDAWKGAVGGLAATLDQASGAVTGQTRAMALEELEGQLPGVTTGMKDLGVSARTLSQAAVGNEGAMKRVLSAFRAVADVNGNAMFGGKIVNAHTLADALGNVSLKTDTAKRQTRDNIKVTQEFGAELKRLPKRVQTHVKAEGIAPTTKGIAEVVAKFKLVDKKKVRALIQATGADTTVRQVNRVAESLKRVGQAKPDMRAAERELAGFARRAKGSADDAADGITKGLRDGTGKAKPNLDPFTRDFAGRVTGLKGTASAGGSAIGSNMGAGINSGIGAWAGPIAQTAASVVRSAMNAARAEADIHSPSRKMRDLVGKELGRGIEEGMKRRRKALMERGRDMIRDVMRGVREGWKPARKTLRQVAKWAREALGADREADFIKRLGKNTDRLQSLHARRQRVIDNLNRASERLQGLRSARSSFIASTRDGMLSQANVLNAGNNAGTIASSLAAQVTKVKEFARLLRRLKAMKYNDLIIQQIAGAGVEGGMTAAKALVAATAEQQRSINSSYQVIQQTARDTALAMGNAMYNANIKAAAGVVEGLRRQKKRLEDLILDVAKAIRNSIQTVVNGGGNGGGNGNGGGKGNNATANARAVTPDAVGATAASKGTTFVFQTYNPVAEPQSQTTNKALSRVAALGWA